jgi:hypothetical protein
MKFTIFKEPIPYLIVDDVFTSEELSKIYQELEFIQPKLLGPDKTGGAQNEKKEYQKNNTGVFLDELFHIRDFSNILTLNRKFFIPEILNNLFKCHLAYELIFNCNRDTTLMSYYEDSEHYKKHKDNSIITINSWFFKQPKNFLGGEFIFSDYNISVPVNNNSCVIFFSCYSHEVTPVKILNKTIPYSGRFSMSMFVSQGSINGNKKISA